MVIHRFSFENPSSRPQRLAFAMGLAAISIVSFAATFVGSTAGASTCEALFQTGRSNLELLQHAQKKVPKDTWFVHDTIVAEMERELGVDRDTVLETLAKLAATRKSTPVSNFGVGAAVVTAKGDVVLGANIELKSLPLNSTLHAERTAIFLAMELGEKPVEIITTAAPCGGCRQWLNEIEGGRDLLIVSRDASGNRFKKKLGELLPMDFGPSALGQKGFFDAGQFKGDRARWVIPDVGTELSTLEMEAFVKALEKSYAPYSQSSSAALIRLRDGRFVTGSYTEHAAFDGYAPVMIAYGKLKMTGVRDGEIAAIYLLEAPGLVVETEINHVSANQIVVDAISKARGEAQAIPFKTLKLAPR